MKTTFTPGPWIVRCNDIVYSIGDNGGRFIADCERTDKSKRPAPPCEEDQANAYLIAAAPELLAALEALISMTADDSDAPDRVSVFRQSAAAIAKAKGE